MNEDRTAFEFRSVGRPLRGASRASGSAAIAPGSRRRRGGVLLMILVIIVVLSALIIQFTEKGLTEIAAEGHYVERNRLRIAAFSGLETTLAVLADYVAIDGGLIAPAQGWADPLGIADFEPEDGVTIRVSFVDESGRLPLRQLDEGTLIPLFDEMGFDNDQVLKLTNAFLDWVDEDDNERIDGAESDVYRTAEWPYLASNEPVKRLAELAVVDGFREWFFDEFGRPNQYFEQFANSVSVVGDGALNANSISDLALRSIGGFGDPQIQALRDYLAGADRVPGTEDDRYFATAEEIAGVLGQLPEGLQLGVGISTLRVRIDVSEGLSHYALEAVVQPGHGASGTAGGSTRRGGGGQPQAPAGAPDEDDAGAAQVSYPFVFLELTEDVGQNSSIAAPAESNPLVSANNPGVRPAPL